MNPGFAAARDRIVAHGVDVAAEFDAVKDPRPENRIAADQRPIGYAPIGAFGRDAKLIIADNVACDVYASGSKNQNARGSGGRIIDRRRGPNIVDHIIALNSAG